MIAHKNPSASASALFDEIASWPIIDPHSHINPHNPAARDWDEILSYHYYTELAHSAGMPTQDAAPDLPRSQRIRNITSWLPKIENTIPYAWLVEIAATFHNHHEPLNTQSIDSLTPHADRHHDGPQWDQYVWQRSNIECLFLTNDFDDPLEGWNTSQFIPCLRTDDLVFKLHEPSTLERLATATQLEIHDEQSLRIALGTLFAHFTRRGAKACAISLPPTFTPRPATPRRAATPIRRALRGLPLRPDEHEEIQTNVFWTLAEFCAEFQLPFDLMIGVHRNVYPNGVAGGRDLLDRRVSLHDYQHLFQHFPTVTFPISTLAPDAAPELVAYSWIFPNVVPMGHWWYANIPAYIKPDLQARLQAIPKSKPIAYYSDAYKLEFVLPKFNMYRRVLANCLAESIEQASLSESQAIDIARAFLLDNPRRLFRL